jgi:hypothetical protein
MNGPDLEIGANYGDIGVMIGVSPTRRSARGFAGWVALGLAVFLTAPRVWAADVVELHFQSASPDKSLEDLLYLAIGVELSQAGLSSSRGAGTGTYVLALDYITDEGSVHLTLTLNRLKPQSVQPLATEEDDLPLNDAFEAQVGLVVKRVLDSGLGQARPASNAETTIGGILPEQPSRSLPTTISFRTDAVFGGTAIFGDLAKVSHGGWGTALDAGAFWLADTWSLKVGTRIGTTRLVDNQGVTGGPLYLSSAAIGADWGTGRQLPFRLLIGGSLGTLVLTVAGDRVKSKTVPWADADSAIEFPLGAGFSLGAELRLQAALEKILIWGLSPALTVGKEF